MSVQRHLCGIYQWRNSVNGKIYIGSSQNCDRRMSEHRSRLRRGAHINGKLQAAWTKYGEGAFEFSLIFTVLDRCDLESVEQAFLDASNAVSGGYNLAPTAGNTFGWKASAETRKRMSDAAKLRDHSVQVKAMAAASKGKKRPQHVIDAIIKSRTGAVATKESRAKMSAAAKARGSNLTPEAIAALVVLSKARAKFTSEQMGRMALMRAEGATLRQIGAVFGIAAESSVHLNIKRWHSQQAAG